ncbi:prolyl oligopeptidase family serine peptidase [Massilia suwonensis]|uniref:Prolyl oligopeptidase family serine peptidase n=1 Tax=Massilia suwonensis TaxID=648895 RepID=A0ABW0MP05_9BURK
MRFLVGMLCCLGAASCAAAPSLATSVAANARLAPAPLFDTEDFQRPLRLRQVRLSPDGNRLAYLDTQADTATLFLLDTVTRQSRRLLAIGPDTELHWSSDGALLFAVNEAGVSALDLKDGSSRRVSALGGERARRFAGVDPALPRHLLVRERDPAGGPYRLLRVQADGSAQLLHEDTRPIDDFLVDASGALRLLRVRDAQQNQLVLRREKDKWIEAARCRRFRACALLAPSADGARVLMRTVEANDRQVLSEQPLAGGAARVLHRDPLALADLETVVFEPRTRRALLATYALPVRRHHGLDPASRAAAADIARLLPGASLTIEAGGYTWLLAERGARLSQPRFWLYDTRTRSVNEILGAERMRARPLPEAQLASTVALSYRASDGATVHGYLSLPPGRPAATLPLLTLVHGGPWNHVDAEYSALVQLLANRGYAVFQSNFRASTGYGERYMRAPGADFGNGRVQADIVDGVRWLLAQGVGDARRLGILGASFGGYSTLLALSHTPELFKVGIALQPPLDFARALRLAASAPARDGAAPFGAVLAELGIRADDAAAMRRLELDAPLVHTARVRAPLLIAAGSIDDKVEIGAVTDYTARLLGRSHPVSLLVASGEGHHARSDLARRAQLHLVLRMLQRHLGGPPVPAPDKELADYLARHLRADGALAP